MMRREEKYINWNGEIYSDADSRKWLLLTGKMKGLTIMERITDPKVWQDWRRKVFVKIIAITPSIFRSMFTYEREVGTHYHLPVLAQSSGNLARKVVLWMSSSLLLRKLFWTLWYRHIVNFFQLPCLSCSWFYFMIRYINYLMSADYS